LICKNIDRQAENKPLKNVREMVGEEKGLRTEGKR
jgi:hypothetical protein